MRQFTPYLFLLLAASFLYSCKSAKLSDAEEKQRIGEYFEAAAIYRESIYEDSSRQARLAWIYRFQDGRV